MLISYASRIRYSRQTLLPFWEEQLDRTHCNREKGLLTQDEYTDALAEIHAEYWAGVQELARRIHPLRALPKAIVLTVRRLATGR